MFVPRVVIDQFLKRLPRLLELPALKISVAQRLQDFELRIHVPALVNDAIYQLESGKMLGRLTSDQAQRLHQDAGVPLRNKLVCNRGEGPGCRVELARSHARGDEASKRRNVRRRGPKELQRQGLRFLELPQRNVGLNPERACGRIVLQAGSTIQDCFCVLGVLERERQPCPEQLYLRCVRT